MTTAPADLVRRGDALHAAAARLQSAGTAIGDTGSQVRRTAAGELAGDAWLGVASVAAHQAHTRQANGLDELARAAHRAAEVVDRLGTAVTESARREAAVLAEAAKYGWRLSGDVLLPVDPRNPPVFGQDLPGHLAAARATQRTDDLTAAAALYAVAAGLRRVDQAAGPAALVDAVQGAMLTGLDALGPAATGTYTAAGRLRRLIAAGDPVQIRAFVGSLSPAVRNQLAADFPELVGPTNGMPPLLRYAANRKLLEQARFDAERRGDLTMVGRLAGWLADHTRQFLLVDIAGGRIAEVLGNLDTAAHVGVLVPGINNSLASFDQLTEGAANLQRQTDRLAAGGSAMISWLGYRPPGLIGAPFDDAAEAATHQLRDLIAGLVLRSGVTITVVAHSYGSLLAGLELRNGLRVDSVVVLGSPGMGTLRASGLHIPVGTRLYAARAPGDYVGWSENFGRDPADPRFGATRIATGSPGQPGPREHTSYFNGESECTRNLARILSGRYSDVTTMPPDLKQQIIDELWLPRRLAEAEAAALEDASRRLSPHLPEAWREPVETATEADARLLLLVSRQLDYDLAADVVHDLQDVEAEEGG